MKVSETSHMLDSPLSVQGKGKSVKKITALDYMRQNSVEVSETGIR